MTEDATDEPAVEEPEATPEQAPAEPEAEPTVPPAAEPAAVPVEHRPAPPPPATDVPTRAPVPKAQIALAVLALLVVALVIVSLNDGGDDSPSTTTVPTSAPDTAPGDGPPPEEGAPQARAEWPQALSGRPRGLGVRNQPAPEVQVAAGTASAVYIWSDFDGWHLWAVGGALPPIRGTLSSNDTIAKAELAIPEVGSVSVFEKTITFDIPADAPLSGIDFNPGFFAQQMVITLEGPAGPIPVDLIRLGETGAEAPFPVVFNKAPR